MRKCPSWCLEVCLYGIRDMASATSWSSMWIWDLECSTLSWSYLHQQRLYQSAIRKAEKKCHTAYCRVLASLSGSCSDMVNFIFHFKLEKRSWSDFWKYFISFSRRLAESETLKNFTLPCKHKNLLAWLLHPSQIICRTDW